MSGLNIFLALYVGPDIMAICLELYLKYSYSLEKLPKEKTGSLPAQCIIYIGSKLQETERESPRDQISRRPNGFYSLESIQ